jgi:hypothetical protein
MSSERVADPLGEAKLVLDGEGDHERLRRSRNTTTSDVASA